LRIALVWHAFGHDNLGVDALARANAALIGIAAEKRGLPVEMITVGSSQRPNAPDLPANVTVGPRISLKQLARGRGQFVGALRACDLAIDIGEGDSFTDIYGAGRFALQTSSKLISILSRQPLVLAPQTIGPFDGSLRRRIAAWIMSRAEAVYTRDHLSTTFVESIAPASTHEEFIDVAFALPFTPSAPTGDKIRVGINVSGLLYNESGSSDLGMKLDYATLTRALLDFFRAEPNVEISLFAHVAGGAGTDDDGPVVEKLGAEFPDVVVRPRFASSMEAKSWMSGLDFVIAGRMHACIGAYSACVPVVPVAYSRKFNGLFSTLGYTYFVDGKAATTEEALADIKAWFADRPRLKAAIEASRPVIHERLQRYEASIGDVLASVAAQRR
jgi:polysaccharide pyruvyl transferase WcaK-like protein